jgi:hypothetical protein
MELAEILGGAPAPVESASTVEPVATPEPVAQETQPEPTTTVEQPAQPRDERGRFAQPEDKAHTVPVAALIEERRKRQELEQRLQHQPVTDEQFWQSPTQAAQQMLQPTVEAMQQQMENYRFDMAEALTRSLHPDYDQVREGFLAKRASGDPWAMAIDAQMRQQANPAKFVYDQWSRVSQVESIGDLSAYRARIEAEVRAQVLKELHPNAPVVPRSLNSEPSAQAPTAEAFQPTPIGNLFNNPSF